MKHPPQPRRRRRRARPNNYLAKALAVEGYLTVSEVAARVGVSRVSVFRWVKAGGLPQRNVDGAIFIKEEILEAFLVRRAAGLNWRNTPPPVDDE